MFSRHYLLYRKPTTLIFHASGGRAAEEGPGRSRPAAIKNISRIFTFSVADFFLTINNVNLSFIFTRIIRTWTSSSEALKPFTLTN